MVMIWLSRVGGKMFNRVGCKFFVSFLGFGVFGFVVVNFGLLEIGVLSM